MSDDLIHPLSQQRKNRMDWILKLIEDNYKKNKIGLQTNIILNKGTISFGVKRNTTLEYIKDLHRIGKIKPSEKIGNCWELVKNEEKN